MSHEGDDDWYCCDDEWSVWHRVETWTWAALLIVQMSMVFFLVVRGRKDKTFRQAFYVLFVAVTLVDCALALLRPLRFQWGETIFGTVYDTPFIEEEDPETHETQYYPTIRKTMNMIVVHAVVPALAHAQPLFLSAIAVNRFTAFAFPLKHASMWRTRTVVVVMGSLTATSVVLGAACPIVVAILQGLKCPQATEDERFELNCGLTWAFEQIFIPTALTTFTSAICCVVTFILNVGSIAMLIVLRTTGRLQRKGPELQLFAHSIWMFLLQVLLVFCDIVFVTDNPETIAMDLRLQRPAVKWLSIHFRHSSEWLAGVKASRKWEDGWLIFMPGCTAGGYWEGDTTPKCSVWYRLLIGELELREDTYFSVRTLELCLFMLSGSVFLLIISGNVRNAYFNFYLKRQCLKKICWRPGSVNIVRVTARPAPTPSLSSTGMSMPSRH